MKKILGVVVDNNDPDQEKKVRVNLIGHTDNIPTESLPWAIPMGEFCNVPNIDDEVWVYVDSMSQSEDLDYSFQWYSNFTEETYKECYEMSESKTYKLKNNQLLSGSEVEEPDIIDSVEYPKNRVFKISGITMEFDEGNERWCLTDTHGNYLHFNSDGFIEKSIGDKITIVEGEYKRFVNNDTTIEDVHGNVIKRDTNGTSTEDGNGNKITTTSTEVLVEKADGKKISLGSVGIEINSTGSIQKMVLGDFLMAYLNTQIGLYNSHVHPNLYVVPLIPLPGPPAPVAPVPTPSQMTPATGTEYLSQVNKND